MRTVLWLSLAATMLWSTVVDAKDASLSMIYTTALHEELPYSIFTKGNWGPDPKARFVKLHMHFDEPIMVKGLEIDNCGTKLTNDLSIFFNFDQWILRLDPKLSGEIPRALYPRAHGNRLVFDGFKNNIEVRSLTFNFESNSGFRVCGIHLMDPQGQIYQIKTPALVGGTVSASSVLEPRAAYEPIYLFDSRFEYGWASNQQATDVGLTFNFDQPQRVEKIRIWNGYQRSITHCYSNSRARTARLRGDGDYSAEISIKDVLGSQEITLPKPFEGRELRLQVVESYLGKSYKDLVISELRFYDGKQWFMLDPTRQLKDTIKFNREQFSKAHAATLLNDSYIGGKETWTEGNAFIGKKSVQDSNVHNTLRLRADGSFYMSGYFYYAKDQDEQQYFALGNYEIKEVSSAGLKLRMFGLYHETQEYGDCNGCGRDCNQTDKPDGTLAQKIFQENFTIKSVPGGKFLVINQGGGKKIKFDTLELSREKKGSQ
jgi:hypothetical protein